jgi:hypothetical protein
VRTLPTIDGPLPVESTPAVEYKSMNPLPVVPVLSTASPAYHCLAPLPSRFRVTVYVYGPVPLAVEATAMNSP